MQKSMQKGQNAKSSEALIPSLVQTIEQAFQLKRNPLPWGKAIGAGICSGTPVLIGLALGNIKYGMLAGIGSFTYLYVSNIPYTQRAKRLFFVMLGLSLSVGLGTLVAPHPLASAFVVGMIGAVVSFIFGAFKIQGPSSIFFVMGFSLATGMPLDPAAAPVRAGLVLLGGALGWAIAMIGWLRNPHGPETTALRQVYRELAGFIDSVGTNRSHEKRQKLVSVLKSADETLSVGQVSWQRSGQYQRLLLLNDKANTIFLDILERLDGQAGKLPPHLGRTVRAIADSLDGKNGHPLPIDFQREPSAGGERLEADVREAAALVSEPITVMEREEHVARPSFRMVMGGAFDKNSIVFLNSIRFGLILAVAAIFAYSFELNRSYWVTLSCAAVMAGSTLIATFHRAIQRTIGTVVGIMVATIILSAQPQGWIIAVLIMALTALTELSIVLNYGLAAFFITPNALLLAESMAQQKSLSFFASARIVDVLMGCAIGLIGTLMIGRRQASSLLPHYIAKTIRSEQQYMLTLFSDRRDTVDVTQSIERRKLHTNLGNLKLVYATAVGEVPGNKTRLQFLWPAIFSIEHVAYLLDSCLKTGTCPVLSDAKLSQLLLAFETMAISAEQGVALEKKPIPEITGFSQLEKEIRVLQDALQVSCKDR